MAFYYGFDCNYMFLDFYTFFVYFVSGQHRMSNNRHLVLTTIKNGSVLLYYYIKTLYIYITFKYTYLSICVQNLLNCDPQRKLCSFSIYRDAILIGMQYRATILVDAHEQHLAIHNLCSLVG